MNLYDRIKALCDEQNISIRALEIKAGIGNGVIGKWRELGPTLESLRKVSGALGVPLDELMR